MGYKQVSLAVLQATIAKIPDPFYTKDVSEHPDMLGAHPSVSQHSHYHAFVGRCISERVPGAVQIGSSKKRGAKWTMLGTGGPVSPAGDANGVAPCHSRVDVHREASATDLGPQYSGDAPFTRRMRRHQSWYRAQVLGVTFGTGPKPSSATRYGNMLTREDGKRGLNFLTDEIRAAVRERLDQRGGTIEPFRLRHNMLSSMPMCFNLFGQMVHDLALATRLWQAVLGDEVAQVTRVHLEWSPKPAREYLADRTAFDAFVEYTRPDGALCFTGIETKLTEPFSDSEYPKETPGYARWLGLDAIPWRRDALPKVDEVAHNQLWRDHLLAFSMLKHRQSPYAGGRLMLVRHDQDTSCQRTVAGYQELLRQDDESFIDMTLWRLVQAWEQVLVGAPTAKWLADFRQRYLDLELSEPPASRATLSRVPLEAGAKVL